MSIATEYKVGWLTLLLGVCFSGTLMAQRSEVRGVVSIFNSASTKGHREYVVNAQVEDPDGRAQPVLTDSFGNFTLIYINVEEKTSVRFQVKAQGLQVVNIDGLTAVTGEIDTKNISMAVPDSIAAYRMRIYEISKKEALKYLYSAENSTRRKIAELTKLHVKDKNKLKSLVSELGQLEEKEKLVEAQAKLLADKYAAINLDDASPLFRKAFGFFQAGQLDSAQLILKNARLPERVDAVLLEGQKIENEMTDLRRRDSVKNQQMIYLGQTLELQGDLFKTQYEFGRAADCYQLAIKVDSLQPTHYFQYAKFLEWLNDNKKAILYYIKCIKLLSLYAKYYPVSFNPNLGNAYTNLGLLYEKENDFDAAEDALTNALSVRSAKESADSDTYEPLVAIAKTNLAMIYADKKENIKAQEICENELPGLIKYNKATKGTYNEEIAYILNNLGLVYEDEKKLSQADSCFHQCIALYRTLARSDSATYLPILWRLECNLFGFDFKAKNSARAETEMVESLKTIRRLAAKNKQVYEPDVAVALHNLGTVYIAELKYRQGEIALDSAIIIRRRLAEADFYTYGPLLTTSLLNIQSVYKHYNHYDKAVGVMSEAVSILKKMAARSPEIYNPTLADASFALASDLMEVDDYNRAEIHALVALNLYRHILVNDIAVYRPLIIKSCFKLGDIYTLKNDFDNADAFLTTTLKYERQYITEMHKPDSEFKPVCKLLLMMYCNRTNLLKKEAFITAKPTNFDINEKMLQKASKRDSTIAQLLTNYYGICSWYCLFAQKFHQAEHYAREGLAVKNSRSAFIMPFLAHALLLEGNAPQAYKMYKNMTRFKFTDGHYLIDDCIKQLKELHDAHVISDDNAHIKFDK